MVQPRPPADRLHVPAGSSSLGPWSCHLDPGSRADLQWAGVRTAELALGESLEIPAGDLEMIVVPLSGGLHLQVDGRMFTLSGRTDVFSGPTDVLYVGRDSAVTCTSVAGGSVAFCLARADRPRPPVLIRAQDVPIEVRGGGDMTRIVRNFGTVGVLDECDRLIACEVITPAGNFSGVPAHKHDERTASESHLEEIYLYEIRDAPDGTAGTGFHRNVSSPATPREHPVDLLAEVRSGDVVLVPSGWHGPCIARPGHDMYYLNVMAGPGENRAWNITDHPREAWIRSTWDTHGPDPRATALLEERS